MYLFLKFSDFKIKQFKQIKISLFKQQKEEKLKIMARKSEYYTLSYQ